jgi:hypothetical protein
MEKASSQSSLTTRKRDEDEDEDEDEDDDEHDDDHEHDLGGVRISSREAQRRRLRSGLRERKMKFFRARFTF